MCNQNAISGLFLTFLFIISNLNYHWQPQLIDIGQINMVFIDYT